MPEPRVTQHSPMHPTGRLFAAVAFIEAVTWAGLLIGMWMKYGPMANVALVKLFGPLHGVAFLVYVAVTLFAAVRLRWPWWASALALLAAIPPLVTLPLGGGSSAVACSACMQCAEPTVARPFKRMGIKCKYEPLSFKGGVRS